MVNTAKQIVMALYIQCGWDYEEVIKALNEKRKVEKQYIDEADEYDRTHTYTCIMDKDYPTPLRRMVNPPILMEFEGDLQLLNEPNIIGTDDRDLAEALRIKGHAVLTETNTCILISKGNDTLRITRGILDTYQLISAVCAKFILTKGDTLNAQWNYGLETMRSEDRLFYVESKTDHTFNADCYDCRILPWDEDIC